MIIRKKRIQINSSGSELTYTINSDNPCMSISPSSGTISSGDIVDFTFTLQNESCFSSTITLNWEDSSGCETLTPYVFTLTNQCQVTGSLINQPATDNPYVFVLAVNTNEPYTTNWSYNEVVFNKLSSTNNSLVLELINESLIDNSQIVAKVKTTSGCENTFYYDYEFCQATATDSTTKLLCGATQNVILYASGRTDVPINVVACAGKTIDYSTFKPTFDATKLFVEPNPNDETLMRVWALNGVAQGTYYFTYKIKDSDGVYSNEASVRVTVPGCISSAFPIIPPTTIDLTPVDTASVKKTVGVEELIYSSKKLDWDTFTFVANTGQTLNSAKSLTATNGDAIFDCDNREIEYTVGSKTENVDLVEFKISDIDGQQSSRGLLYINYEAISAIVAADDTYTVGKSSVTNLDILSNDPGNININSVEILTAPTKGLLDPQSDGSFDYTVGDEEGSDSFTYKYYDVDGIESSTATVDITIENAGTGTTQTVCKTATEDLTAYLNGTVTSGGTWSQSGSNPVAFVITDPTNVNTTSATPGSYSFTYTLAEDSSTITLIYPDNGVDLISVSSPVINPLSPSNPTTGIIFSTTGVTTIGNITVELDYDSGSNVTNYYPSIFNPITGQGQITLELDQGAGDYEITISVVDICGVTYNDSQTITL